jgi:hypothetical protein
MSASQVEAMARQAAWTSLRCGSQNVSAQER